MTMFAAGCSFPRRRSIADTLVALVLVLGTSVCAFAQSAPTFSKDIAPLLFSRCASCHRPGEIGGFSLLSYADARPRAAAIARVTRDRSMPPWPPDQGPGLEFIGERRLASAEIETLGRWAAGGAPEGSPADLPAQPEFASGWQLGTPDLEVASVGTVVVPAGGPDLLRNIVIPLALGADRYVRGLEFRPDNPRVVHHANIRVDRTHAARALDAVDTGEGFDGRLNGGAEFPDGQFLGWTPGQLPPLLDGDHAWKLEAGSDLVVQLHLRPADTPQPVRIRIGLFFTDHAPRRTPVMLRLGKEDLDIAAGASAYISEDSHRLPVDTELLAIQPHAHYRAREVRATAVFPDGRSRELIRISRWDFDWQDQYRYRTPVALPRGTLLRMRYVYDNSAANRRNPQFPPVRVRWGQNSSDEMGDVWFQLVATHDADRPQLVADTGRKILSEDAVGYETLLESEPGNARLHEAAGALYLSLGQVTRGIAHLESAVRLDPASVEAHYNLGTALTWTGRPDEAMAHLQRALDTNPEHVGAHINLGALLRARGSLDEAIAHLQRALALAPRNANAHASLAAIRLQQGRTAEAVREYRAAIDGNPALVEALAELSWTIATDGTSTLGAPAEAVAFGERARALTGGRDPRVLDALAASYASAGRYADAVRTIDAALALANETRDSDAESVRLLRERRQLYSSNRPYRNSGRAAPK